MHNVEKALVPMQLFDFTFCCKICESLSENGEQIVANSKKVVFCEHVYGKRRISLYKRNAGELLGHFALRL